MFHNTSCSVILLVLLCCIFFIILHSQQNLLHSSTTFSVIFHEYRKLFQLAVILFYLEWLDQKKLGHFLKKIIFKIKPIEIGSLMFSQPQAIYLLLLRILICSLWYFPWFWLTAVISLVLVLWRNLKWPLTINCICQKSSGFFKVQWNQQCMKSTSWPMEISITIDAYEKWDRENNVLYLISYKMHSVIRCTQL